MWANSACHRSVKMSTILLAIERALGRVRGDAPRFGPRAIEALKKGGVQRIHVGNVMTGEHPPGTIVEFSGADFKKSDAPSPHYAGLPTVMQLAALVS